MTIAEAAQRDLTVSECARLCGLSRTPIYRMFDRGQLAGYRLPSGYRRIPVASLRAFMVANGIPTEALDRHARVATQKG